MCDLIDLHLLVCPVFDTIDIIWSVQAVSCSSSCNEPFKQSLICSTCTWLLPPAHDWFDLYSIHSPSISLIQPVFDHSILYSICLTCRGCIPSIQHVFGWFGRYWSHKSRNWAAFAIYQVYRYHSMTVTFSSHAFNTFDLYLMESFSISWIIPLLDWFDLCWICATCIRLLPPYLDHSNSIWWFQTALLDLNSVWFNQPALVGLPCVWYNWYYLVCSSSILFFFL